MRSLLRGPARLLYKPYCKAILWGPYYEVLTTRACKAMQGNVRPCHMATCKPMQGQAMRALLWVPYYEGLRGHAWQCEAILQGHLQGNARPCHKCLQGYIRTCKAMPWGPYYVGVTLRACEAMPYGHLQGDARPGYEGLQGQLRYSF